MGDGGEEPPELPVLALLPVRADHLQLPDGALGEGALLLLQPGHAGAAALHHLHLPGFPCQLGLPAPLQLPGNPPGKFSGCGEVKPPSDFGIKVVSHPVFLQEQQTLLYSLFVFCSDGKIIFAPINPWFLLFASSRAFNFNDPLELQSWDRNRKGIGTGTGKELGQGQLPWRFYYSKGKEQLPLEDFIIPFPLEDFIIPGGRNNPAGGFVIPGKAAWTWKVFIWRKLYRNDEFVLVCQEEMCTQKFRMSGSCFPAVFLWNDFRIYSLSLIVFLQ